MPTKSILTDANVPIIGGHHVLALHGSPEGWEATWHWSVVEKTQVAGGRAHLVAPAAFEANIIIAIERITGRDGGKREIVQAAAGLLLERDRLGLTGVSAAALLTTSDFDVERVLRLRVGFGPASVEAGVTDIGAGATPEAALRPRPRSFAVLERCSE